MSLKVPDFPTLIRQAREWMGWPSMSAAAREAGVHRNHWSRVETGVRPNPQWRLVYTLIAGGALPLEIFFPEEQILDSAARINARPR